MEEKITPSLFFEKARELEEAELSARREHDRARVVRLLEAFYKRDYFPPYPDYIRWEWVSSPPRDEDHLIILGSVFSTKVVETLGGWAMDLKRLCVALESVSSDFLLAKSPCPRSGEFKLVFFAREGGNENP